MELLLSGMEVVFGRKLCERIVGEVILEGR